MTVDQELSVGTRRCVPLEVIILSAKMQQVLDVRSMIGVDQRRVLVSAVAIIIALVLFLAGVRAPDYGEYRIVRSIYYAAAAVILILGLLPWTRE